MTGRKWWRQKRSRKAIGEGVDRFYLFRRRKRSFRLWTGACSVITNDSRRSYWRLVARGTTLTGTVRLNRKLMNMHTVISSCCLFFIVSRLWLEQLWGSNKPGTPLNSTGEAGEEKTREEGMCSPGRQSLWPREESQSSSCLVECLRLSLTQTYNQKDASPGYWPRREGGRRGQEKTNRKRRDKCLHHSKPLDTTQINRNYLLKRHVYPLLLLPVKKRRKKWRINRATVIQKLK